MRGDIVKTMHRAMSVADRDPDVSRLVIHGDEIVDPILGRLVERGPLLSPQRVVVRRMRCGVVRGRWLTSCKDIPDDDGETFSRIIGHDAPKRKPRSFRA
jgi:hypothetical protein